jgi:hopanoid biosynthesis associated radical SAM protein HpnH
MTDMIGWEFRNWWRGNTRYPYVLMLEPLHTCNLACLGCSPERYNGDLRDRMSLQDCLQAVDEAGAPVVSICGGEPTIYPELAELVDGLIARKRHIYLCTNGLLLERFYKKGRPHKRLSINVHLDGMRETHDMCVEREGVFDEAIEGIKAAKAKGFLVCTNTTIYKETDLAEIDQLFAYLTKLGVDGFLLSPAYGYSAVKSTNPTGAAEIFMTRDDIRAKFKEAKQLFKKYNMNNSPVYMEFLAGERELTCTAWGNPTRNVKGWKGPCYLITDQHHDSFDDLMEKTEWDKYGAGKDPRCEHCMVHCGFEPSAALGVNGKLGDSLKMLMWQLS